jgi:hypothetical protein
MFAGQVMVQTPLTVTVNVQIAELPAQSKAVQVTVVVPFWNVEPDGGLQEITAGVPPEQMSGQLSVTVGLAYVTTALPEPGGFSLVTIFAGQVIVGACVSLTVTVNVQGGPVVGLQVTVVVPVGKKEPDAGEQVIVPQLPVGAE